MTILLANRCGVVENFNGCGEKTGPFDYDYSWVECNLRIRTINLDSIPQEYSSYKFQLTGLRYYFAGYDGIDFCDTYSYEWLLDQTIDYEVIQEDTTWHTFLFELPYPSEYYSQVSSCDSSVLASDCDRFVESYASINYNYLDMLLADSTTIGAPYTRDFIIPDHLNEDGKVAICIEFEGQRLEHNGVLVSKPFNISQDDNE